MEKQVGSISVTVRTGGYPVWVSFSHEGMTLDGLSHKDLRDLEYAVKAAIEVANAELKRCRQDQI